MTDGLGPQGDWSESTDRCRYNPQPGWDPANECGKPCTIHLLLTGGEGCIGACEEHEWQALSHEYQDCHLWGTWCNVPGSLWVHDRPSYCELDGSGVAPTLTGTAEAQ